MGRSIIRRVGRAIAAKTASIFANKAEQKRRSYDSLVCLFNGWRSVWRIYFLRTCIYWQI
jgi:hypothetical protein